MEEIRLCVCFLCIKDKTHYLNHIFHRSQKSLAPRYGNLTYRGKFLFSMAVSEKGLTYNKVAMIFQLSMDQPKDG